jgi:hypothetical protein
MLLSIRKHFSPRKQSHLGIYINERTVKVRTSISLNFRNPGALTALKLWPMFLAADQV